MFQIRKATVEDLPFISTIFRDTVQHINSRDYNEDQIRLWASKADELSDWEDRIENSYFVLVIYKNKTIVGFANLINGNYLEHLYVHKDFQRRGVATYLIRIIESNVISEGYEVIKSDITKTALLFFENQYYDVQKKGMKSYKGLAFENYIVTKNLME